jgi:hypothetical protein
MAPRTAVPALLLLVGAFCACLAQSEELSLLDVTQGSSSSKAAISSYGYGVRVERTCMEQNQVKNCRVTGCEDCYDGLIFQTDFGCCDSHSDYSHPKENLADATMKPKVSGCQWNIDLLKEFKADAPWKVQAPANGKVSTDELAVIPIEEGVYIQLGTVTGTCTMTEASDKCEGPYCSDMTITMQGGLYATLAYSKERGNTLEAPAGDLCHPLVDAINNINNVYTGDNGACKPELPEKIMAQRRADRVKTCVANEAGDAARIETCYDIPGEAVASVGEALLVAIYGHSTLPDQLENALAAYTPPAEKKSGYYDEGAFAGIALTVMGQTTISSLKHPLKVESTGHLEYTPVFLSCYSGVPMKEKWPTVMGGAMKLWFKSQEEVHEPEYKEHPKYRA